MLCQNKRSGKNSSTSLLKSLSLLKDFFFFDFEAFENAQGDHEVNLAMAQKVCAKCLDSSCDLCEKCNVKHIFYNKTDYCLDFVFDHFARELNIILLF